MFKYTVIRIPFTKHKPTIFYNGDDYDKAVVIFNKTKNAKTGLGYQPKGKFKLIVNDQADNNEPLEYNSY